MKKFFAILLAAIFITQCFHIAVAAKVQKKKSPIKSGQTKKHFKLPALKKVILKPAPFKKEPEQKPAPFTFPSSPEISSAQKEERIGLSVGIKAGASAGLTGALGEVSYSLDKLVPGTAVRGSVGYLTGSTNSNPDSLKMATVNLDAIYSLTTNSPFNVYVGAGFIYPLKVNKNRGAGAWGAHAYLGSKYALQDNTSIYGELAYTGIKYQADQAALRGVEAMMGYSYSF